ncbi:MAG TPA: hypothetical protein VJV05_08250 [Pyrinomonadaceae bacterium]|nr:hypothetical protein [Pyrinomonadaceae bacterium]
MTSLKTPIFTAFLIAFLLPLPARFQAPASNSGGASDKVSAGYVRLSDVKEGMKGTARTVFRGSEPEEFNVEILGIVPGAIGPKQDLIVGKLSGGGADRTAVFAGMSGSPVYVDGKLLGAISYSFPFSKEPICGITPIEQMIAIFEQKQPAKTASAEPRAVSFAELASNWTHDLPKPPAASGLISGMSSNSLLMAVAGQSFQPIATPVTFTGLSQETLNTFAPQLMQVGLVPVSSVGGAAPMSPMKKADASTLVGGDSVSMHLTRGDYSMAAAGTVTLRDGDKIYAFGHPFLSLGTSDLPMSESHVVAVIPSVANSFKLAVPDSMVGTMTQDRATGVFGKLGQAPKMIPVRMEVTTSRGQKDVVNFEVAKDDFLTPLLLNIAVYNTAVAQERSVGDATVEISGSIAVKGQEAVRVDRRFAGGQAATLAAASVAGPVAALMKSRFDDLDISGIDLKVNATDGSKTAVLDRMSIDKLQVKAGESVEVQAFARTNAGKVFLQRIPVTIPVDTPTGMFSITVADGREIQQDSATQQFVPRDLAELIATINKLRYSDRLYLQTFRTTNGAIIGSSEMPNLPPSVLATLNNDRTAGGIKPAVQTIVNEVRLAPAEFLITGQQTLTIEVVK